jgi:uncharacterized membrane protein
MRNAMLILHFIGLAMGLGTSFAFMFLGRASSKMEKSEALKFTLNTFALSKMGHIGLTLLVVSGIFLMTPFWGSLLTWPLLMTKLVLVLVLGALVGIISAAARKAKNGDAENQLKKIPILGRLSLLTSLAIVIIAVLIFQ